MSKKESTRKRSTVRHTRAIQRDRSKRPVVAPPPEQVQARLKETLLPVAQQVQKSLYRQLGLRVRDLPLVVMLAFVLNLIWRQVGCLSEGVRLLNTEGVLWAAAVTVSQQAVDQRMGSLPAELFLHVLVAVLPVFHQRWQARQRPLPPELAWAQQYYTAILACDGSTLDALLRKVGLLRGCLSTPLAGKMTALLDLCSRLPRHLWYEDEATVHDQRFWPRIVDSLSAGALLIFDLGYTNFTVFAELTAAQVFWITRAKGNLAYQVEYYLHRSAAVHDLLVWVGPAHQRQLVRLVEVR